MKEKLVSLKAILFMQKFLPFIGALLENPLVFYDDLFTCKLLPQFCELSL